MRQNPKIACCHEVVTQFPGNLKEALNLAKGGGDGTSHFFAVPVRPGAGYTPRR